MVSVPSAKSSKPLAKKWTTSSFIRPRLKRSLAGFSPHKSLSCPATAPTKPPPLAFEKLTSTILYFRIPFGSPDAWVKRITPYLTWLFTLPTLICILLIAAITAASIAADFSAFTASFSEVFAPDHTWRMLACWIALKAIHELGHAVACRRFGGEVRDCGVAFFFLAPAPYVDVTSCWRFHSKWERIVVALAGMYVEFIAALSPRLSGASAMTL